MFDFTVLDGLKGRLDSFRPLPGEESGADKSKNS